MPLVSVQWATNPPQGWTDVDVSPTGPGAQRWRQLARKAAPTGGESIDGSPGWIFDLAVDGVHFAGHDSYAVDFVGTGANRALRVYAWTWDTEDFTDPQSLGYRWGEIYLFHPHRPDPRFGGKVNTHQVKTVYSEDLDDMARFFPQETSGGPVQLRPWSEFPTPPAELTRHGVWVRDENLWRGHFNVRAPRDWRGWS
jgi:hypothetical protein